MQTFWVSDGLHSVHTITLSDMDAAVTYDGDETQEKLTRITVIQAVLSAEKIQDLIPLGANGILILGQAGNIYIHTQFPEVAWRLELIYLLLNQLVLNLEYGLFSATENHFCCTASYLELEPLNCRYNGLAVLRPLWSSLHVLCCCAAQTKRTVNTMKM